MLLGDMIDFIETNLGETVTTNVSTDPRFFTKAEVVLWLNLYRKQLNQEAKILRKKATVTTTAGTRTYAFTAFTTAIIEPVDYHRITYGDTTTEGTLDFVDKSYLDLYKPNWLNGDSGSPSYIYLDLHNVFGLEPKPDAAKTLTIEYVYPPAEFLSTSADTVDTDFVTDTQDLIPCYAALSFAYRKRGRSGDADRAWQTYLGEKAKLIGMTKYDQQAKLYNFRSFTDEKRRIYRRDY